MKDAFLVGLQALAALGICRQRPAPMTILIAALLLGVTAAPPPDDDDDKPRGGRTSVSVPKTSVPQGKAQKGAQPATSDKDNDDVARVNPPGAASRQGVDQDGDEQAKGKGPLPPGGHDVDEDDEEEGRSQQTGGIVITAHKLDAARTQIDAALGSTVYSLTNDAIENRPGGETGSLAAILTQAPGVTISGSTLTVRGSRANQLRINNVIIPEAISDPADLISSRLAQTTRLITGTLPSQYAFAPAGVISITTKNGLYQHGGEAELFAGSDGMFEPAFEWAGSAARTSLFISGELERNSTRVADLAGNSARDQRTGIDGLGFADHVIDGENRLSFIFGGSHERRRIGATSVGRGHQTEDTGYGVATYQHSDNGFTVQASLFAGAASDKTRFTSPSDEERSSWGTQIDASDTIGDRHILRFGLLAARSTTRELDLEGDRTHAARTSLALYAQDEWKLAGALTFNPGVRLEWLRGMGSSPVAEPRASLVWETPNGLSAHLGYARYASAPPLGEQSTTRLSNERDDYFDAGIQQKLGPMVLGLDGYWRSARNYIAEHQPLATAAARSFAFDRARMRGLELSVTYARGGTTAWTNLSLARAEARTIIGGEGLFMPETIAATSSHYVPLASDRPVTLSGGLTHRMGKFSLGGDILISSGAVRTFSLNDPNGERHSAYALVGLAAVYHARIAGKSAQLRVDLTNLTNVKYATADAANLEGGWTRHDRGRAITVGIEQSF